MNWFRWRGEGYYHVQAPSSIGASTIFAPCGDSGRYADAEDWRHSDEPPTPVCRMCRGWAAHYRRLYSQLSAGAEGTADA